MNYQKQLEEVIKQEKNNRKKLLLHSCCAPCSSYVLEYLREYFDVIKTYKTFRKLLETRDFLILKILSDVNKKKLIKKILNLIN